MGQERLQVIPTSTRAPRRWFIPPTTDHHDLQKVPIMYYVMQADTKRVLPSKGEPCAVVLGKGIPKPRQHLIVVAQGEGGS